MSWLYFEMIHWIRCSYDPLLFIGPRSMWYTPLESRLALFGSAHGSCRCADLPCAWIWLWIFRLPLVRRMPSLSARTPHKTKVDHKNTLCACCIENLVNFAQWQEKLERAAASDELGVCSVVRYIHADCTMGGAKVSSVRLILKT